MLFGGKFKNDKEKMIIRLTLISFKDENNVCFVYFPHLDLTGYGNSDKEAKSSFELVLEEFFDYILKKKTLNKVLTDLRRKIKSKKAYIPDISKSKQASEILNKYPVRTFHKEVGAPVYA